MENIIRKMNLLEHCPGCGALLPEEVFESICGNCGFTTSEVEMILYGRKKQPRKRRARRRRSLALP